MASLALSRSFFWFLPVRRSSADMCPECAVCGRERDSDPAVLLKQGHRRAAIWAARTEFEKRLTFVIAAICATGLRQPKTRKKDLALDWLAEHGYIERSQASRFAKVYSRASEFVHGGPLSKFQSAAILRELIGMCETLAAIEPKPVELVSVPSYEVDYEREQLIEQFGDAMLAR